MPTHTCLRQLTARWLLQSEMSHCKCHFISYIHKCQPTAPTSSITSTLPRPSKLTSSPNSPASPKPIACMPSRTKVNSHHLPPPLHPPQTRHLLWLRPQALTRQQHRLPAPQLLPPAQRFQQGRPQKLCFPGRGQGQSVLRVVRVVDPQAEQRRTQSGQVPGLSEKEQDRRNPGATPQNRLRHQMPPTDPRSGQLLAEGHRDSQPVLLPVHLQVTLE